MCVGGSVQRSWSWIGSPSLKCNENTTSIWINVPSWKPFQVAFPNQSQNIVRKNWRLFLRSRCGCQRDQWLTGFPLLLFFMRQVAKKLLRKPIHLCPPGGALSSPYWKPRRKKKGMVLCITFSVYIENLLLFKQKTIIQKDFCTRRSTACCLDSVVEILYIDFI